MKANYHWDGCTWCGACDLCIDHQDCRCTPRAETPPWSAADVEEVAQATIQGLIPDLHVMTRLGPTPPTDFTLALGRRVQELVIEQKGETG